MSRFLKVLELVATAVTRFLKVSAVEKSETFHAARRRRRETYESEGCKRKVGQNSPVGEGDPMHFRRRRRKNREMRRRRRKIWCFGYVAPVRPRWFSRAPEPCD